MRPKIHDNWAYKVTSDCSRTLRTLVEVPAIVFPGENVMNKLCTVSRIFHAVRNTHFRFLIGNENIRRHTRMIEAIYWVWASQTKAFSKVYLENRINTPLLRIFCPACLCISGFYTYFIRIFVALPVQLTYTLSHL